MGLVWEPTEAYFRSILGEGKPGWLGMVGAALLLHEATQAAHFYQRKRQQKEDSGEHYSLLFGSQDYL